MGPFAFFLLFCVGSTSLAAIAATMSSSLQASIVDLQAVSCGRASSPQVVNPSEYEISSFKLRVSQKMEQHIFQTRNTPSDLVKEVVLNNV
jgi:hypothetical protein